MAPLISIEKPFQSLLEMFTRMKGFAVPVVSADSGEITTATASSFTPTYNKLSYMNWLIANATTDRIPTDATPQSATIVAGSAAINFNGAANSHDICAYEIYVGFSDNTPPGSVDFSHIFLDADGTTQTFNFSLQPDFSASSSKQSKILYLGNGASGAKYYPLLHRTRNPIPIVGGVTIISTNDFSITGPNDVRISILPIVVTSTHLWNVFRYYPRYLGVIMKNLPKK